MRLRWVSTMRNTPGTTARWRTAARDPTETAVPPASLNPQRSSFLTRSLVHRFEFQMAEYDNRAMKPAVTICLFMFSAIAGLAQTLTCTFQFTGSGTLGIRSFTNANITITTVANASAVTVLPNGNRPITPDSAVYTVPSTMASMSISGVGTSQFTVPTLVTITNNPNANNSEVLFGVPTSKNLIGLVIPQWMVPNPIGPVTSGGYIWTWNATAMATTNGTVNIYDQFPTASIVFQSDLSGLPRKVALSQIAAGGGWSTVITVFNPSPSAVPLRMDFHDENGSGLNLPITTTQQGVSRTYTTPSIGATLSPNTTLSISMGDQLASTVVGWADVTSTGSLGGFAIFRQIGQNGLSSEGTVPLQNQFPTTIILPFDNTAGFLMGVALANLAPISANVVATFWDDSGNQLGIQNIVIPGNGHTSFVLPIQFALTAAKRGIVQFKTNAAEGISGLGLRFSPFGTFTSVPTSLM